MSEVVTILSIDADPAVAGANKYADAMGKSQSATEKTADQQKQLRLAIAGVNPALLAQNDNLNKSVDAHNRFADAATRAALAGVDHAASVAATTAKWAVAGVVVGSLAAVLGTLYTAYKIVKTGIDLVSDAWELGGQKLEEFRQIALKAAGVDLSTDFFQKISKGATDAKLPVDALTEAIKKLRETSTEKLGGSALQNRIDQSVTAGNFAGNTGVDQLAAANTTEQKFRAIVSLVDQAMTKGERLAALDLAGTALGPGITANLLKDSDYLKNMLASADAIKETDLVSSADVGRALELQSRMDAATKILEQRWHPMQDVLTTAGINMRAAWVGIVEATATAFDWVSKMAEKIAGIPQTFWEYTQRGLNAAGSAIVAATTTPESRAASEQSLGITSDPAAIAAAASYSTALTQLRARLQNVNAVQQAVAETNAVQNAVWKDTSHAIDNASKALLDHKDALARAMDSVEKYILTTNASAASIGAGAFEQEKARVIAQLTAAALRDGKTDLEKYAAAWDDAGNRAGAAARNFKLAGINSEINFGRQTSLLSPDDVAIAQKLKSIYPDVATALASVEASAIRVNAVLSDMSSFGRDVFSSSAVGFFQQYREGQRGIAEAEKQINDARADGHAMSEAQITTLRREAQEAANVWHVFGDTATKALDRIEDKLISMAVDNLWKAAFGGLSGFSLNLFGGGASIAGGATSTGAAGVGGIGGLYHTGGIVGSEPTAMRYIHSAYFDDAPRFHGGGLVGNEIPIIAKPGEGVFTPGQMAALGRGGGANVKVVIENHGNSDAQVQQSKGPQGEDVIRVIIGKVKQDLARTGFVQKQTGATFGAQPKQIRR